jgi:Flp pilus assembly protein TadD
MFDWWGEARVALLVVPLAMGVAACQPSTENRALLESGMKLEDPKYYPSDNFVRMGKVYYRNGQYGLAEESFRKAVEQTPTDSEAWLGLAATYDQLRRFDLADQAYLRIAKVAIDDPVVLNNAGYSQLLRGNTASARRFLLRAHELDPDNPYIANNLALLGETGKTVKRVPL